MAEEKKQMPLIKLKGVRVMWAKLITPEENMEEGKPAYWTVNMYVTPEDADLIQAHGVNPKKDKEGQEYYRAKRLTVKGKGTAAVERPAPKVFAPDGRTPFDSEVGNGSICNINVLVYNWEWGKKKGKSLFLAAVQVVDPVAPPVSGEDFDPVEGYEPDEAEQFN